MLRTESLLFFPLEKKHKNIILDWFEKEHVRQFYYGQGLENTLKNLDLFVNGINRNQNYSFEHWIAYIEDK